MGGYGTPKDHTITKQVDGVGTIQITPPAGLNAQEEAAWRARVEKNISVFAAAVQGGQKTIKMPPALERGGRSAPEVKRKPPRPIPQQHQTSVKPSADADALEHNQ